MKNNMFVKSALSTLFLCSFLVANDEVVHAYDDSYSYPTEDIPRYDGTSDTYLELLGFSMKNGNTQYVRAGDMYTPEGFEPIAYDDLGFLIPEEDRLPRWYFGEYFYPNISTGISTNTSSWNGGTYLTGELFWNMKEQQFIHIYPVSAVLDGNTDMFNFILADNVNDTYIEQLYNGDPDFVRSNINKYGIYDTVKKGYGWYYYVRELAYLSGGTVWGRYGGAWVNIIQSADPDIETFEPVSEENSTSIPVNFNLVANEYVYAEDSADGAYSNKSSILSSAPSNPFTDLPDRSSMNYVVTIDGPETAILEGTLYSEQEDSPLDDGTYVIGETYQHTEKGVVNDNYSISWQPTLPGDYTATITMTDAVGRDSNSVTTTFVVKDEDLGLTGSNGKPVAFEGEFGWHLVKPGGEGESKLYLRNIARIKETHLATRNLKYSISGGGINLKSDGPIATTIDNTMKGSSVSYEFSYEYLNEWTTERVYDEDGKFIYSYKYLDWSNALEKTYSGSLSVDHQQGETISFDSSNSTFEALVGQGSTQEGETTSYYEEFDMDVKDTEMQTQNWLPIDETVAYSSDEGLNMYVRIGDRELFVDDIDPNLQEEYKNVDSKYASLGDYDLGLRLAEVDSDSARFKSAEDFYLTENNGFLFSTPYGTDVATINNTAKEEFESFTGANYHIENDPVLDVGTEQSSYYLNIDFDSPLQRNTWYDNIYVIGTLGLNDITFKVTEKYKFEDWLIGDIMDEAWVIEQPESSVKVGSYSGSVTITPKERVEIVKEDAKLNGKLHSIFSTDNYDMLLKIKEIIPGFNITG